jgi:tungstate transport system ATP-binding protein
MYFIGSGARSQFCVSFFSIENRKMIRFRNVKKYYRNNLALDLPALDFKAGMLCVIVGANGSGKTTLLRLINGLEKPSEGEIQTGAERRDMTYCFQKPFMFSGTVKDNICFGLTVRKQKVDQTVLAGIVEAFGLNAVINQNAKKLSAGEIQRVSIARALILRPKLLLLDEPAASVDPESIHKIEEAVVQLHQAGSTIIVATHIIEQAYRLSANVTRLEKGRVVAPELENIFEAEISNQGDAVIATLSSGIKIVVVTEKKGHGRIAVPPSDIIISPEKIESSVRNGLAGRITGIMEKKESVELSVDAGLNLKALITPLSLHKMHLTIGSEVFASFKASSVKVF